MSRWVVALFLFVAFLFSSREVLAQSKRTWVSGVGDDVNTCTRTAPCRTFAGALARTVAGGEIDVLDGGGFGAVTINKSVTIDGTGTSAGIQNAGANGIVVNDTSSGSPNTIAVALRGLAISGGGSGLAGVKIQGAGKVSIDNCTISGNATGIDVSVGASLGLLVRNTVVRNNTGDGISLSSSAFSVNAVITGSSLVGNGGSGLRALANSRVMVTRSDLSMNAVNGAFAEVPPAALSSRVLLKSSTIGMNGANGIRAGNAGNAGLSIVSVSDCDLLSNLGNAVLVSTGGSVFTGNDNRITGNGTDGCPGCSPDTKQ